MAAKAMLAASAALALLALAVPPIGAFVQLMSDSDAYCDSEGSFCQSDSSCCSGLECVPTRAGGGSCRQRRDHSGSSSSSSDDDGFPRYQTSHNVACQSNTDCASGQCCIRRSLGVRGASINVCSADCSRNRMSNILDDFYSRYYRRALRSRHQTGSGHRGSDHTESKAKSKAASAAATAGERDDKKKKKKTVMY